MRLKVVGLICCLFPMVSVALANPAAAKRSHHGTHAGNCALYARDITGIHISGDAGAWWHRAEGRYQRGSEPAPGAVLVFKPHGRMHHGHVAVVSRVVNRREILVDQANWVRGRIVKAMSVIDISPGNDWTRVKVIEMRSGTHGRDNPTFGFVYPRAIGPHGDTLVATARQDRKQDRAHDHRPARAHNLPVKVALDTPDMRGRDAPGHRHHRHAAKAVKPGTAPEVFETPPSGHRVRHARRAHVEADATPVIRRAASMRVVGDRAVGDRVAAKSQTASKARLGDYPD